MTGALLLVPALGSRAWLGWTGAAFVWLVAVLVIGGRVSWLVTDRKRPPWLTRLIDEPLFVLWGAALLSVPLFVGSCELSLLGSVAGWAPFDLNLAAGVASAAGLALSAWGTWVERHRVRVVERELVVPGLPAAFDGYRIVHVSDLHIGSFHGLARGLGWIERANSLRPDLVAVTGDLLTTGDDFVEDAAEVVGALRAPDGVVACLGNHDVHGEPELTRALERRGVRVLRNAHEVVRRGDASVVVAGVDELYGGKADLDGALAGRPEATCVLLAHFPDFLEPAALRGVDIVLSGHTHGGQIGVPFLADRAHVGSLTRQRSRGVHRRDRTQLVVSAGLGTTGPPLRLGIRPEIGVVVLRSAPAQAPALDTRAALGHDRRVSAPPLDPRAATTGSGAR
ncbi:MAG: metallophosphoesterase [Polyangiaceae bacterium]|nr:metallophosphoesterase [Polyangiaceae bacterium]